MTMSITKGHTRLIPCSLHSDCKNVQKSALKSVNVQRTGKSILQMFAFSLSSIYLFFAAFTHTGSSLMAGLLTAITPERLWGTYGSSI